jgi:hypothetical protein
MAEAFGKRPPYKKVTPFLASLVWRIERVKGIITGKDPLLTKETAETAQQKVYFDNSKISKAFPSFTFKPVSKTIQEACAEYSKQLSVK